MRTILDYAGLLAVLLLLVIFFAQTTDHFYTPVNFITMANQIPVAVLIATGMTFVLITGGIDLSVGSMLALSGAVLGIAMADKGYPLAIAVPVAIGVGLLCGAVNGWIVTHWPVPPFIVTLGMLEAARGAAYYISDSQTKYIGAAIDPIVENGVLGFSFPFTVALATVVVAQITLSHTALGRRIFAVGSNEEAARLSGLNIKNVKRAVYLISGSLAGLAAVIHCARMSSADPNAGSGYELDAIAAVVVGGTSLMGGRGSVIGSFIGVLIIAVLENGLAQLGAQDPTKRIITGIVIVLAVIIDYYRTRLRKT